MHKKSHKPCRIVKPLVMLLTAVCFASNPFPAIANINVELRPLVQTVDINATVNVGLYLVSDNPLLTQYSLAAEIYFGWDNTKLRLLGLTNAGAYPTLGSGFPNDSQNGNVNEVIPPQDGDGFYSMIANFGSPVPATPAGTLITTFQFRALAIACNGAPVTILPQAGNPSHPTKVYDGFIPNFPVTGTLGSCRVYIDVTTPVITMCAPAQTIPTGASCMAVLPDITGGVVATDNCPVTVTQSPVAGTMLPLGPQSVTLTVRDPAGHAAMCMTTVTVADQSPPNITMCAPPQMLAANASCQAQIPNLTGMVTANDNCSQSLTITQSPVADSTVGLGQTMVTITVKDAANNQAMCQTTVTVTDQTPPNITSCAPAQMIPADANCQAAIPNLTGMVTANDNCGGPLTVTQFPLVGTMVGLGQQSVTITVKDAANNAAMCQTMVTVVDTAPPVISVCAPPQTVAANANCQGAIPDLTGMVSATDNCSISLSITQSPTTGTLVSLGEHSVTLTVKDAANNQATCETTVTVTDQTAPEIMACAPEQTVPANANCEGEIPDLTGLVSAEDNCGGMLTITQSPTVGTVVGLGSHVVTLTVRDAADNGAICESTVTVADQTAPMITSCAGAEVVAADENCQGTVPDFTADVTASDNCTASENLVITQDPPAGALVNLGSTSVTITVEDAAGNPATCQTNVTVTDQTDPTITGCPDDIGPVPTDPGQADAVVTWTPPTADDNCQLVSFESNHEPGDAFPIGTTSVTYTATDGAGNVATCSFTVTVVDQEDPMIVGCPMTITADADVGQCDTTVTWDEPTVSDNAPGATIMQTMGPPSGSAFPVGTTHIVYVATDAANNMETCQFDVIVVDSQDPVIDGCPDDIDQGTDDGVCSAVVSWTPPTASDNCGVQSFVADHDPGETFSVGTTTVTYTATDIHGRHAECVFTVTVHDDEAPTISVCPPPQESAANAGCQAAVPDFTADVEASDNCTAAGELIITQSPAFGTLVGAGSHAVTITVADAAGNESTCETSFTVNDETAPVFQSCPSDITANTNTGSCAAIVTWAEPTATDNCGMPTVMRTQGPAPNSTFANGTTTTIEYTATDAASNTATCSFTITVTAFPDLDDDADVDTDDEMLFIAVLLGTDTTPLHVARADVNCDGMANGLDIQPFVEVLAQ